MAYWVLSSKSLSFVAAEKNNCLRNGAFNVTFSDSLILLCLRDFVGGGVMFLFLFVFKSSRDPLLSRNLPSSWKPHSLEAVSTCSRRTSL